MDYRAFDPNYQQQDAAAVADDYPQYEEVSDAQRGWAALAQILASRGRAGVGAVVASAIANKGRSTEARNEQKRREWQDRQAARRQTSTEEYQRGMLDARETPEERAARETARAAAETRARAERNETDRAFRDRSREDSQAHGKEMAGVVAGLKQPREPRETPQEAADKAKAVAEAVAPFKSEPRDDDPTDSIAKDLVKEATDPDSIGGTAVTVGEQERIDRARSAFTKGRKGVQAKPSAGKTAQPPSFKPGQKVRDKKTGKVGTVDANGNFVPD